MAFSLGKVRGNAVLGQPLALAFDVKLEGGEDLPVSCIEAQVVQGDSAMDSSRLRVSFSARGADSTLELSSSQLIEEPSLAITLRAGCDQKTSRKYVLLTELPGEGSAPGSKPIDLPVGKAVAAPLPDLGRSLAAAPAKTDPVGAGAEQGRAARATVPRPARGAADGVASASMAAAPSASASAGNTHAAPKVSAKPLHEKGSRLKLEAADMFTDRVADLRLSPSLSLLPQEGPSPQRSQAQSTWAALNASPEQLAADEQRKTVLEAQNKTLSSSVKATQGQLSELKLRLQEAEAERFANPLVYVLGALLGLSLVGGALAWKRRRAPSDEPLIHGPGKAKSPWWQTRLKPGATPAGDPLLATASREQEPSSEFAADPSGFAPIPAHPPLGASPSVMGMMVDLDLSESAFRRLEDAAPAASVKSSSTGQPAAPSPSPSPSPSALPPAPVGGEAAPADLFDVQQHAEFFVSLGQYDEAIAVLRHHIEQYPAACPLAYLDLLKIHHTLSHTLEYASLREAFNRIYSAEVPLFSGFSRPGGGLSAYPATLARLEEAWGGAGALAVVEECLYRPYADAEGKPFDLDAFKDLLVLQAVAAQLSKDLTGPSSVPRIQAGDLSLAFQSSREGGSAPAAAAHIPAELMPLDPISGFGPSTQLPVQESVLDLDLSEPEMSQSPSSPPPPANQQDALGTSIEFESIPVFSHDAEILVESPLDAPPNSPDKLVPTVVDEGNLIDFDIFEEELKAARPLKKTS